MSAARFLLVSFSLFVVLLAGYFYVVDRFAFRPLQAPPRFYPQILLEASRDLPGKVVVEAGSSAVHSIDPLLLADFFKAPVIVTAVNAGYPLKPKLYNLERYLVAGDVLILPLEWNQYVFPPSYPADYIAAVSGADGAMSHLYRNLPLWQKLEFVFSYLPFRRVLEVLLSEDSSNILSKRRIRLNMMTEKVRSQSSAAFGGELTVAAEAPAPGMYQARKPGQLKSCDAYFFLLHAFSGADLSVAFQDTLQTLSRLQNSGVRIYFTWPAVVDHPDSSCYGDTRVAGVPLEQYARDVRSAVESAGFQFIAEPQDSHFPAECFLNTYYHLTAACARQRSERLIDRFVAEGVKAVNSKHSGDELLEAASKALAQYRAQLAAQ